MRISHHYRFVFLAYPRTASRSVRELLDPYSDIQGVHPTRTGRKHPFAQHMPAREAKQVFDEQGWNWFDYQRFCVVRNPYTRVVSLYHHYQDMRTQKAPGFAPIPKLRALVKYAIERPKTFKEYVLSIDIRQGMTMPLYDFIHDDAGNCLVNDVLKYEELPDELPLYLRDLGIEVDASEIPRVGSSGIGHYRDYYDEETRAFVANLYQYEIDRFKYSFEDLQ